MVASADLSTATRTVVDVVVEVGITYAELELD